VDPLDQQTFAQQPMGIPLGPPTLKYQDMGDRDLDQDDLDQDDLDQDDRVRDASSRGVEVCVQDCWSEIMDASHPMVYGVSSATWEQWFQTWLVSLEPDLSSELRPEGGYELSLRLTGDRDMQAFNRDYRHQDKPTDVLAFAALETEIPTTEEWPISQPLYLGDIVISVETAQVQAQRAGHSLEVELAWLAAHGLLHLLGWDHPDEVQLQDMLDRQEALLHTVGITLASR
jgi:probable rRNA maturation factor